MGVPEQRLRNWLHRNKTIDLLGARPENGWRSFGLNDLFILAVAGEFIKYGCPVPVAVDEARTALGGVNFDTWEGRPDYVFAAETAEGWRVEKDEGLLWAVGGQGPTVIKIDIPVLFARVRARLGTENATVSQDGRD